jgi:large subunit ribosomal protein L6
MQFIFWFFSPNGVIKKVLSDLYFFKKDATFLTFFFLPTKKDKYNITTELCLLRNSFIGISRLFKLELWLKGVGFKSRVFLSGLSYNFLKLSLGFSHILLIRLPKTCTVFLIGKKKIYFKGTSLQDLTQLVSYIQNFKLPDPYKGKGLNYKYKVKKLKQGKKN